LLDAFAADEPGLNKHSQMLAGGWLADAELLRDKKTTDAVLNEITRDLPDPGAPRRAMTIRAA